MSSGSSSLQTRFDGGEAHDHSSEVRKAPLQAFCQHLLLQALRRREHSVSGTFFEHSPS